MDGDHASACVGTAGSTSASGLNAGFLRRSCAAAGAPARRHVRDGRDARPNGAWARGGGGSSPRPEGSSVSDQRGRLNAKKRRHCHGAAMGKEAAATFAKVTPEFGLQMGEATGPNSKKSKIEDETVRPKVEEEAATASDGSARGERGRKQAKGKGSKSKQPADERQGLRPRPAREAKAPTAFC
ncbi:hypothetical protein ZWY2020_033311 [Hordeum vulgare]|nr:hypothetical protein ZWY2020_033311 [Hordeum vulgare]